MADFSADNTAPPDATTGTEGGNALQSFKPSIPSLAEAERANAIEYLLQVLGHNGKAHRGGLAPDASAEPKPKESWFSKHQTALAMSAFISFPIMLMGAIIALTQSG
ncbi:MAG: hypothetical protein LBT40_10105, partial [Deltaproteobacteria bacterium]|nr:hypothetical protein [Deltaproteobacteria bacterium]